MRIYVHVEVEGCIFTKELEPDPNLTYTYTWDKRNIYKQKVNIVYLLFIFGLLMRWKLN